MAQCQDRYKGDRLFDLMISICGPPGPSACCGSSPPCTCLAAPECTVSGSDSCGRAFRRGSCGWLRGRRLSTTPHRIVSEWLYITRPTLLVHDVELFAEHAVAQSTVCLHAFSGGFDFVHQHVLEFDPLPVDWKRVVGKLHSININIFIHPPPKLHSAPLEPSSTPFPIFIFEYE